jgi:hypothetical protein
MANDGFPKSHFEDNTIIYEFPPKLDVEIDLEGLGVKIGRYEEVKNISGLNLVIKQGFRNSPERSRFRATSSHTFLKGETITVTGPHNATLELKTKTGVVVKYEEFGPIPPLPEQQAAPEDTSSAEPANGLTGSKFTSNELHVSHPDGTIEFHGLGIPHFKSSDVTFYNVSGNLTAIVTFDGKNPDSPIVWGARNLIVWEEGVTVEVKGPLVSDDGPFIELSFRSDGLVAQRQIFRRVHPSASDKEALAKLAKHKSWDAYITSRK